MVVSPITPILIPFPNLMIFDLLVLGNKFVDYLPFLENIFAEREFCLLFKRY